LSHRRNNKSINLNFQEFVGTTPGPECSKSEMQYIFGMPKRCGIYESLHSALSYGRVLFKT